jgi:hypothetical protein
MPSYAEGGPMRRSLILGTILAILALLLPSPWA